MHYLGAFYFKNSIFDDNFDKTEIDSFLFIYFLLAFILSLSLSLSLALSLLYMQGGFLHSLIMV
jgi:hypothetical protein